MNLIPHVKGAEAFGIGCLHELRGTIGSIADELAAEILCDWALISFSPRNLTQVTSAMKPVQDSMVGFSSVKRISLREGLY